jgi:cytochrome c peroxidase
MLFRKCNVTSHLRQCSSVKFVGSNSPLSFVILGITRLRTGVLPLSLIDPRSNPAEEIQMREMKSIKLSVICGAVLGTSIVCSTASGQIAGMNKNAIAGPLPPPVMPPDEIALTPVEKLGKFMLYDHTLSNPSGYACATCHVPAAGFTGPDSSVNLFGGPQPGVVPGRFSNRKPQSYVYTAFCPVGPVFNANLGVWIGGDFWDGRVPDLSGQAKQPPINPNEMNNTPVGPYPPLQQTF